jgi:putative ABC transport system permease protein
MNGAPLSLRLAVRELRGGVKGFRVFVAVLVLGVSIIAAVGSLSASLVDGLRANARALLGGDVAVDLSTVTASAEQLAYFRAQAIEVSAIRDLRAMVRLPSASAALPALVELKAVDQAYPLYGEVKLDPPQPLQEALQGGGAVAEKDLFDRLGLAVGDCITVGEATFVLRARIADEPDRSAGPFSLGPRLMIADRDLAGTGLVVVGSLVHHEYRLRLAPSGDVAAWTAALRAAFPDAGWRLRTYTAAQPQVQRFVDRFGAFLILVGLTVLVLGGVGVANAVQNYIQSRTETIATLKCLGAEGGLIFRVHFWQVGALAALGIVFGLALGALAPLLAPPLIGDAVPVPLTFAIHPAALAVAAVYGALTTAVFALWPLSRSREIPAAGLFRAIVAPARRLPRTPDLVLMLAALAILVLMAIFGAGNPIFAAWFIGGSLAVLIGFRLAALGVVRALRALPRPRQAMTRLAVAALTRPGAPTANVMLSLGAGLSVLVSVALLDANITREVRSEVPERVPAFFFIDIQADQAERFDAVLRATPGVESHERVPTLRGRVASVGGVTAETLRERMGGHWWLRQELTFTYVGAQPSDEEVVAGQWWQTDYAGPPLISLDANVARELGINVGEAVTFSILGREVAATVANLRRIDWEGMGLNFSVIFAPGTLERAPQTHVGSAVVAPEAEAQVFAAVAEALPSVTIIRVRDLIERVTGLIEQIGVAVRGVSILTIAAGVLVLAGAVAAGRRQRLYDSVILKVLGATRADVLRATVLEYAILGALTAVLAAAAGTLAAWGTVTFLMEMEFSFAFLPVAQAAAGGLALVVLLGLAGTWTVLSQRPAPVLRTA